MRLATFDADGATQIGALLGEAAVPLQAALDAARAAAGEPPQRLPGTMTALLAAGEEALVAAGRALAFASRPDQAALLPGKVIGVGRNYADHAKEVGGPALVAPRLFLKPTSSVCGPGAVVSIPPGVTKPDWEVELGVVIGRRAWQVGEGTALDHVAGYAVLNDISAREFQFDQPLPMTSFAKGLDGFCPLGPALVTAEEVGEPWQLGLRCWLNGELVQEGNTRDLIFSVAALIAYVSRYMALEPGDVIATGTPAGSGHFRTPPRYLRPGDRMRLEVERVGTLEHGIG
jgi:2-keto-4-pentenoate hydratase/2-oxohepta-3-ene-1,7-dioic acid hydratase in catechol pathway